MVTTKIKNTIENIITDNDPVCGICLKPLLSILSVVYGGAVTLKRKAYQKGVLRPKKLPCIVISIGNLTMGGTGKTPMTLYVAERIKELGYTASIISRGYKGRTEKKGGIVSDGRNLLMSSKDAGDEPFMMASILRDIPVVVGQNRFDAGMLAVRHFDPDVLVLDDAFQHVKLKRDIDLVLLDYRRPFGNGCLLPLGVLREPITSLFQADALILTRFDADDGAENTSILAKLESYAQGIPIFKAYHVPYIQQVVKQDNCSLEENFLKTLTCDSNFLKGRRVFPFSGIANHKDFLKTVESLGAVVTDFQEFPDHYQYKDIDYKRVIQSAVDAGTDYLVTTEKDYVRMANMPKWPVDLVVLGVGISFGEADGAFKAFIKNRIEDNGRLAKVKEYSGE